MESFVLGPLLCHHAKEGMLRGRKAKKGNCRGVGWVGRIGSQHFQLGQKESASQLLPSVNSKGDFKILNPQSSCKLGAFKA